jgi:iron complex transport system substrate-binding protein
MSNTMKREDRQSGCAGIPCALAFQSGQLPRAAHCSVWAGAFLWAFFFVFSLTAPIVGLFGAAPVRVVSQTVGSDELLLALAEPGQIAALSHLSMDTAYSAVTVEAKPYPQVDSRGDAEGVLKYAPTLVLFADYSRAELVAQVRRAGVKTIIFDHYRTLEDSYANLRLLARELGAEAKCERLIAHCETRVQRLRERLRGVKPVRVISPSIYAMIPGDDTTFQDLCDHAMAENLAATLGHLHGHEPPPTEQMLIWPVDAVVVSGTDLQSALAPFKNLPPYSLMPAVRENRAALLQPYQLSCVSHYRIEGYEQLARALHPEAFR